MFFRKFTFFKVNLIALIVFWIFTSQSYPKTEILEILKLVPSQKSTNYVYRKQQFQLHTLLTEHRHNKTRNLSSQINIDTTQGLQQILSVDQDIAQKFIDITNDREYMKVLETASSAISNAIIEGKKVYIYGCGATGRLAKQIESVFWRQFLAQLKSKPAWIKVKCLLERTENNLIGVITGGDRALISSLEGFEDLQLIGMLQLKEHDIKKGDVVFAITEGGETSSVIGAITSAASMYDNRKEARNHLFYIYNNPDNLLKPFIRSKDVIENQKITKINLTTGAQALAGSTRMQATTTDLFVMGVLLENAIYNLLKTRLTINELSDLGFSHSIGIKERLLSFSKIQKQVYNLSEVLSKLTDLETDTYKKKKCSTYLASNMTGMTVFTDVTERAPTFRLAPLDTISSQKRSIIQILLPVRQQFDAWTGLLYKPFKGLNRSYYIKYLKEQIKEKDLRERAINSLNQAGDNQQYLYDLSFSIHNVNKVSPSRGDLGVAILFSKELKMQKQIFCEWLKLFSQNNANIAIIQIGAHSADISYLKKIIKTLEVSPYVLNISTVGEDPIGLRSQITLKMILNAHSTAVMAKLGRIVGNTMTSVSPSNLKLIGRATNLIQTHVNSILVNPQWIQRYGIKQQISYADANAVLFDAIEYINHNNKNYQESPEVEISIIRILSSLRYNKAVSWNEVQKMLQVKNLNQYLQDLLVSPSKFGSVASENTISK